MLRNLTCRHHVDQGATFVRGVWQKIVVLIQLRNPPARVFHTRTGNLSALRAHSYSWIPCFAIVTTDRLPCLR